MNRRTVLLVMIGLAVAGTHAVGGQQAPRQPMRFFVTSAGPGDGGNLGGLAGADATCQKLASVVASGSRTWRAYLSTQAVPGQAAINARDRIGPGPWHNAKGALIALNSADLHGDFQRDRNNLTKSTALTEKGEVNNGFDDKPNRHDMLTGSDSMGRAFPVGDDRTCSNWTVGRGGSAQLGHHDRQGGGNTSWNSTHGSRGCSQPDLVATGGAGLFYCFAID